MSVSVSDIDRRVSDPTEFSIATTTAPMMKEMAANILLETHSSINDIVDPSETEKTFTASGEESLLAVGSEVDSELATDGDIDAHGAPVATTSSASRKRRLSDVNGAYQDVTIPAKRPQLSDHEKPVSPTSQDQANCFQPSCNSPTPRSSTVYYDDHGYHSPALDLECSAKPSSRRTLYIEYWSRTDECKERKWDHLDEIAEKYGCAEDHIFATTLNGRTAILEPNMFPYDTPAGIEHWTLWHVNDLSHAQIKQYVENWIDANAPHVEQWNYDDNPERSIDIFHVHVYLQVGDKDSVLRGRKVEELVHE